MKYLLNMEIASAKAHQEPKKLNKVNNKIFTGALRDILEKSKAEGKDYIEENLIYGMVLGNYIQGDDISGCFKIFEATTADMGRTKK